MTTSIRSFIKNARKMFLNEHPSTFTFATGNEATDLDSTICALSLAYVKQTHEGKPLIPFINSSNRTIISMRGELQSLLEGLDLTPDDLIFQDQVLEKCVKTGTPLSLFLVDHNELSATWKLSHPAVKADVRAIIDHHADAGLFLKAQPRIVETCGSNATLLFEYLSSLNDPESVGRLSEVKSHLLSAIVMDTVNFTWRQTASDLKVAGHMLKSRPDMSQEELEASCKPIMNKFDTETIAETSFRFIDLFHKDFKLYEHTSEFFYAISTIKTSFETFIENEFNGNVQALVEAVFEFMGTLGIKLFAITLAVREPGSSSFYQQLGIFSEEIDPHALARHVQESGAQLELISEGPNFYLGMQNNPNVSRKQLQPFFSKFLRN